MAAEYASKDGDYIERSGDIEPLTPRLERYIVEALDGRSLDESHSPEASRVDYACLSGQLAIEIKTLEGDPTERLENLADELRERDDWPVFLGSAPMDAFIGNTSDPDALRRRVIDRIGRAIFTHLRKANKQLAAHARDFPNDRLVRMVLLVNEDHAAYDPDTVGYILFHALRREEGGKTLFENVDGVVYLTERHGQVIEGRMAFPIMLVEGQSIEKAPWKRELLNRFCEGWPAWNETPLHQVDASTVTFSTLEPLPEQLRLQDRWRIEYRRNPYLRSLSEERLRDRFDETNVQINFETLTSSPSRLGQEALMMSLELWSHIQLEMGDRGIPITRFNPTLERDVAAANRLRLRPELVRWLIKMARRG